MLLETQIVLDVSAFFLKSFGIVLLLQTLNLFLINFGKHISPRFEKRFNLMLVAALLFPKENNKLMHQLTALLNFTISKPPAAIGVIYQYYFEQAGVCH